MLTVTAYIETDSYAGHVNKRSKNKQESLAESLGERLILLKTNNNSEPAPSRSRGEFLQAAIDSPARRVPDEQQKFKQCSNAL